MQEQKKVMFDSLRICLSTLTNMGKSLLQELTVKCPGRGFAFRNRRKLNKKSSSSSRFDSLLITPSMAFPPTEVADQLKRVFDLIDANGDGKISLQELREILTCLGYEKAKAHKEAEGMVKEMDRNGDGYVDLEEFMEVVNDDDDKKARSRREDKDRQACLMDAFLIFDANKDGLISDRELRRVLVSLGYGVNCSIQDCRTMIKGVDRDGDGFVNFEEFRSMMRGSVS